MLAAILIFALTYLVLAVGRLPGFRVDRTGAAIIGASLMLAFNVLSMDEAYKAIDYDTIMLQAAGTERTAVRFAIDNSGTVTDVNSHEKSLLKTLRRWRNGGD